MKYELDPKYKDEWRDPNNLKYAFKEAMRKKAYPKGNPPETIDYSNLKVGTEIKCENT